MIQLFCSVMRASTFFKKNFTLIDLLGQVANLKSVDLSRPASYLEHVCGKVYLLMTSL